MSKGTSIYHANKGLLKAAGVVLAGIGVLGLVYYYRIPLDSPLEPAVDCVLRAFEEGRGLEPVNRGDFIDRKALIDKLSLILHPEESSSYVVIVGENGTGKTAAVNQALSALESPKGAVYFNCPVTTDKFSIKLADLVGFRDQRDVIRRIASTTKEEQVPDPQDEPLATFDILMQPLMDAAAKFKAKNGRPMVLVIDSVDRLAKGDPAFLDTLQDWAKDCADDFNLRIVFILSDGSALSQMMVRSSWSRAKKPPFEIGEIPDEQAVAYLTKKGVREDEAKLAVANLTGGLFTSLKNFQEAILEGLTYEQLLKQRDIALRLRLINSKIPVSHALFQQLVQHASIGMDEARSLLMEEAQLDFLLKNNILAAHPNNTYTFHDRHTAVWFSKQREEGVVVPTSWTVIS